MKISDYAVKNYQFTLIMVIMAVALGVTTILTMPRSEDPDISSPNFPVVVVYAGTSPKDMEELVVKPLEKRIYALDNIKQIKTTIKDGLAVLNVDYRYNSNVENKYQELVREVNAAKSQLPQDINSIEVKKVTPSDVNVLQVALVSENASRDKLKKAAEDLQDELEKVTSLKNIEIAGLPAQIVRIDLALDKMAQMHIPLSTVSSAIQSEIANIPGGSVNEGTKSFNIKTSGNYQNIDEIKRTIVFSNGGKNIYLEDIASVYFDFAPETDITRLNGHRCVFVTAAQKPGENISTTQKAYLPVINAFKKTLPSNIDLQVSFDQASNVNRRLGGLGEDFLVAILLVSITLLPLGFRAAIVVMISIPLSLAIGIVLVNLAGYNLNQLSIVGLVVALGLLVDDSIVVVENIERWIREGHTKLEATLKATQQIGLAVVGCTATLIIAFLPLVFLPEASGDFIRSLPVAVIACIIASMIVALTVVPFLSSRLLKVHAGHPEGNLFLRAFKKIIHRSYAPVLNVALKNPWITVATAALIFVGALRLFPVVGFSLFPSSEKPQFLINVVTPLQSNLSYTDSITRQIENDLKKIPAVKYVASNVGKGNPRIYYNVVPQNERADFAELFVQLDENTNPSAKLELIEQLRKRWTPYPGAKIEVKNFEQGPPVVAPVEIRLLGDDIDSLRSIALKVEDMLVKTEGTIYVNNPARNLKSDIKVEINKDKAQMQGVATVNIDRTIRMAVSGISLGTFTNPDANGDDYNITRCATKL